MDPRPVGADRGPPPGAYPEERRLKKPEIAKLEAYLRRKFDNPRIGVRARPKKDDSAEVYIGDEFIGVLFRDDEDEDLSWNFSMAILEYDLEEES